MILVIGDVHIPSEKNFYLEAIRLFYKYLDEKFPDDVLIFSGDIVDNPAKPNYEFIKEFADFLNNRKQPSHIITGNHDIMYRGNILKLIESSKIKVYEIDSLVEINGIKFVFYPYNSSFFETYRNKIYDTDYTVGHYSFEGLNFGNKDEINLPYVPRTKEIIGHIHNYFESGHKLCIGSIFPTRLGEEITKKYLVRIFEKNSFEKIEVPPFFEIKVYEDFTFDIPQYFGKLYFITEFVPTNFKIEANNFEYVFKIRSAEKKVNRQIDLNININDFDTSENTIFKLFLDFLNSKNLKYEKDLLKKILQIN